MTHSTKTQHGQKINYDMLLRLSKNFNIPMNKNIIDSFVELLNFGVDSQDIIAIYDEIRNEFEENSE